MKKKLYVALLVLLINIYNVKCYSNSDVTDIDQEYMVEYLEIKNNNQIKINDYAENFNRKMYSINRSIDKAIGIPVTKLYKRIIPPFAKMMLKNCINNFYEPNNVINFILSMNIEKALNSFWRFFINSTAGIFGVFDVAAEFGIHHYSKSFEEVVYKYTKFDAYFYMPLFGPISLINYIGLIFDSTLNPLTYIIPQYIYRTALIFYAIQIKSDILNIYETTEKNSIDPYVSWRSYYIQYITNKQIVN